MVQATDGGNTSDSPDEEDYTGNEIYLLLVHIIYKKAWSLSFFKFIITQTVCFTFIWNNLVIFNFLNYPMQMCR